MKEVWDTERNNKTLRLACEEGLTLPALHSSWFDAADTKIVSIFAVASVIVSLAPGLQTKASSSALSLGLQLIAGAAFLFTAGFCYAVFQPRDYRVGPNPSTLLELEWLRLTPSQYRFYRMRDIAKTHTLNVKQIERKGKLLRVAMVSTAVEVVALLLAFLSLDLI